MNIKTKFSKQTLSSSGLEDGDYIFINPRHVWRTLHSYRRFLLICMCACMSISQIFSFIYNTPKYISEVRLKVEQQKSFSISPIFDTFNAKDQNALRMTNILDLFQSSEFKNRVLEGFLHAHLPLNALIEDSQEKRIIAKIKSFQKSKMTKADIYNTSEWQELTKGLDGLILLQTNSDNNSILLRATTTNPYLSAKLVNLTSEVLMDYNLVKLREKVNGLKDFVSQQTTEKMDALFKLEDKLVELQKVYRAGNQEEFTKSKYLLYNKNLEALDETERKLKIIDQMIEATSDEIAKVNSVFTDNTGASTSDLYVSQLQHRINILQYQKALANSVTDSHSKEHMQTVDQELHELVNEYKKTVSNRQDNLSGLAITSSNDYYRTLEKSLIDLKKQKSQLALEAQGLKQALLAKGESLEELPDIVKKFEHIKRQLQASSDLFVNLQKKQQEVEIMEAGITNDITLLSKGQVPKKPIGITVFLQFIFSGIIGLLAGVLLIIVKNTFIQTIRSFREMQAEGIVVIGEMPIVPHLGRPSFTILEKNLDILAKRFEKISPQFEKYVPGLNKIKRNFGLIESKPTNELVVIHNPNSSEADIFRFMRLRMNAFVNTNVRKDYKATVCLVTSPTEANGKTFISTNLSASFAKGDIKTLLIDLDLRNSSVHRLFPDRRAQNWVEKMFEGENPEKYILNVNKNYDILLCPRGIKNPTEVLESHELREFIQKQREKYHYIFLDSPPVLAVCDPSLLAPVSDVVLMISGCEVTFREDLQLAIEGLNAGKQLPILGILNLVNQHRDKYSYYYRGDDSDDIAAA